MKRTLRLAFLLLALVQGPCPSAWSYSVTLLAQPYTDVLVFAFGDGPTPPYTVRRTGGQQITVTLHQPPGSPLEAVPNLNGSSLVIGLRPTANGFVIQLKSRAFGYVYAAMPGKAAFELHIFADAVGGRWVDISHKSLTLAAATKPQLAHQPEVPVHRPLTAALPGTMEEPPQPAPPQASMLQPAADTDSSPEKSADSAAKPVELSVPAKTVESIRPDPALSSQSAATPENTPGHLRTPPHPAGTELWAPLVQPEAQAQASSPEPPQTPFTLPVAPLAQEEGGRLSLIEIVGQALRNNPRLLAFKNRAEGAEHGASSALGALLPHAQVSSGVSSINNSNNSKETNSDYINQTSKTHNIQLSQNLFDGLMRLSNYSRAKLVSVRAAQEARKAELDTIEAVQREYFKLIRTRADIRTFQASVARLLNQRDAAHAFYRLEMAPRLTVLQVETALAQMEQRLSKARSDEQVQRVKLNSLMGNQSPVSDFAGDLLGFRYDVSLDFEDCLRRAKGGLPEVVIAKTDVDIAQEELSISEGKAMPRLDASASYVNHNTNYKSNTVNDADRKYYTMGLNVVWEFFSGGEHYHERASKNKLLRAALEEYSNIQLAVHALVRESHLNVEEAKKQIKIAVLRKRESAEAYDQASTRFRAGIGTSIDVLDAHERVTSADAAFNQAQADYLTSLASLYRVMGEKKAYLDMLETGETLR